MPFSPFCLAVGALPSAAARDLILAAAREALTEDATSVPVMQARHVLQLLSQHRLALTASCLRCALLVGHVCRTFLLLIGFFWLCIDLEKRPTTLD